MNLRNLASKMNKYYANYLCFNSSRLTVDRSFNCFEALLVYEFKLKAAEYSGTYFAIDAEMTLEIAK